MDQYEGGDIDPALWFYVPLSRAKVVGLVRAAEAGLASVEEHWAAYARGTLGLMQDWGA